MTTNALSWADPTGKQDSRPKYKNAHALRYDNVTRVLLDLEERACVPFQRKREPKARFEIAELRAQVANLKAENDRLVEKITDDMDGLADRLAKLEARAQLPFWRRALGYAGDPPELTARARKKLTAQLRSIFSDRTEANPRSGMQLWGTGA